AQPPGGNCSSGAPQAVPALFTRMSSCSKRSRVAWARAAAPSGVETSAATASQSPSSASSFALASSSPRLREEMITRAPARSRPVAIMSPIPREPPVTSARLPEMSNSSSIASVGELGRALVQEGLDGLGHGATERRHDLLAVLVLHGGLLGGDLQRGPHPALGQAH